MSRTLNTPVAFLVFNRPEHTRRVFAEIGRARPSKLFIIADGPRPDRADDAENVRLTREIVDNVDWECEVLRDYSDTNLGMNPRTVSGLNWVLGIVEDTIFLEDDCLPNSSFFRFCSELLEKYRYDERIMMISGLNFMRGRKVTPYSYFFSRYTGTWGWATWRRAWRHLDITMDSWSALRDGSLLQDMLGNQTYAAFWRRVLDRVASGKITSWDFNWLLTCWSQNGLTISPSTNLISNIGFGAGATNLVKVNPTTANLPTEKMVFPLVHPPHLVRNLEADEFLSRQVMRCGGLINFIRRFVPSV